MRFLGPGADKESIRHAGFDVFYARRIPIGRVIFVYGQGPYTFDGFAGHPRTIMKTVVHHVALHAQIISQAQAAGSPDLLKSSS